MINKKIYLIFIFFLTTFFIWSFFVEPRLLFENTIVRKSWPIKSLKIAFFSDLHAGSPFITEDYIFDLVERINSHQPDIVLIGGDLVINNVVGGKPLDFKIVAKLLSRLKAPLGKFVVLGNHDWWNDTPKIQNELKQNGFDLLENQNKLITINNSNDKFNLVGIGDRFTNHSQPEKAFQEINIDFPTIVFMHDPASLFEIKNKFFLALAGHTHGGQVFIPGLGALITPGDAPKKWASGWTQFEFGSLYVSQGIGTSILPIRFNSPPEFVILNLM